MKPAAIVLAGGASQRFGSDKLAALVDGRPVLARTVDALAAIADPVVLALAPAAAVPVVGRDVVVARDPEPFGGPLAGLAAAFDALAATAGDGTPPVTLVVAGDMPWLRPAVLELLVSGLDVDPSYQAMILEHEPPALMPVALRTADAGAAVRDLRAFDHRRFRVLLDTLRTGVISASAWRPLDPAAESLRDVDVPADLA